MNKQNNNFILLVLIPFFEISQVVLADGIIKWERLSIEKTKQAKPQWTKITNEKKDKNNSDKILITNEKKELQHQDYSPSLRLGIAVPTANQLPEGEKRFSNIVLSSFKGGESGGTGNQNYSTRFDFGITNNFQISAFTSDADDPLYSSIKGLGKIPANYWQSYGTAIQWKIIGRRNEYETTKDNQLFNLALASSLEL